MHLWEDASILGCLRVIEKCDDNIQTGVPRRCDASNGPERESVHPAISRVEECRVTGKTNEKEKYLAFELLAGGTSESTQASSSVEDSESIFQEELELRE